MKIVLILIVLSLLLIDCSGKSNPSTGTTSDPQTHDACIVNKGLANPIPLCTPTNPCTDLLATYGNMNPPVTTLATPSTIPTCATGAKALSEGRPNYNDGTPKSWTDSTGTNRYACSYSPSGASTSSKRPLVIWIHGSGGTAQNVYDLTSIRTKATNYNLSGDPSRLGFALISPHARNLHWPTVNSKQDGSKWDTFYREISQNLDFAFLDHLVDDAVASGTVDPAHIYIMGWSNGGRFSGIYGIHRYQNGTPGGNRIAAIANYSTGNPFENLDHGVTPSCKQNPFPASNIPYLLVSRDCDLMACSPQQATDLVNAGLPIPPGNIASQWTTELQTITPNSQWQLIDRFGKPATSCDASCTAVRASLNHLRWPDLIANNPLGTDTELPIMNFLKAY
jgi:dienelactone hydrolase